MSNDEIGVPRPEDYFSNQPIVYHLLDLALNLIQPLAFNRTHSHSKALPPLCQA